MFKPPGNGLRQAPIDALRGGAAASGCCISDAAEHTEDVWKSFAGIVLPDADAMPRGPFQFITETWSREEDERFDIRHAGVTEGIPVLQQRFQLLGFTLSQQ